MIRSDAAMPATTAESGLPSSRWPDLLEMLMISTHGPGNFPAMKCTYCM